MLPYIFINGTETISTYNLMVGIALIAALLTLYLTSKKQKIPLATVDSMTVVFVLIILTSALTSVLFNNFAHNKWNFNNPESFITGFTFYGGLLGGILVAVPSCIILGSKNRLELTLLDILATCLMLGHSIGRIGCFLGGCCYGKETDSFWGILYPIANKMVHVYPVQLFESIFLLLLFIYSYRHIIHSLERYLILYGFFRFFIEFYEVMIEGLFGFCPHLSGFHLLLFLLD